MKSAVRKQLIRGLEALIVCLTLVFALASGALAEEQTGLRHVRVAFPTQAGMSEVGESGDLAGYNYLYLQSLAEYAGWELEYITYEGQTADESIMSAMTQVMSGEADLLGPVLRSPQVEEMFAFPQQNYGVVYTTLCALEKSSITAVNYLSLQPLRVAVYEKATTRNEEIKSYLDQMGAAYELVLCSTTEAQLTALQNGEADVLSSITLSFFAGTRAVVEFAPRPYYFVSAKGSDALIDELDSAIQKMNYTQPQLQDKLQEQFFGDTYGGFVLSENEQTFITGMETLNVLCLPNYAPYISQNGDGEAVGVLAALLNDFAAENDIQVSYTFCTSIYALESDWAAGSYDCLLWAPLSPDYCAKNGMIRSATVLPVNLGIVSKPQSRSAAEGGTLAYYEQQSASIALSDYAQSYACLHPDDCIMYVENGDVDLGLVDRLSLDYVNAEAGWSLLFTPLLNQYQDLCIVVSRTLDSRFLSVLNKFIDTLPDGTTTTYLSKATHHELATGLMAYINANPLRAALLGAFLLLLVFSTILLYCYARKNRKRSIQLQKANAAMVQANAAKSEFLSRMSHDIRTPMNAILGFAELGRQDLADPEKLKGDLERISSSGEFLLGLVNDVLDMSKIESRAMTLKPEPYPREAFRSQLETLVEPLRAEKEQSFVLTLSPDFPPCLLVDRLRFNQIFFNLLSNAVKFTPRGGRIEMKGELLSQSGDRAFLRLTVQDNGIGMSEEFQQHMFDSFSQEQAHVTGREGTGLGLSIVKSLVELMGGTITAASRQGRGSTFTVELTCQTCPLPKRAAAGESAVTGENLRGRHVLLCEDHPINRQLACRLLEKVGVDVTCAEDGQQGVEAFRSAAPGHFDAVLMDIRMPVMDGIEATRAIRALDRADARTVPIIAMTANAFADDIEQCRAAGMNAHLSKPFQVERLYAILVAQIAK